MYSGYPLRAEGRVNTDRTDYSIDGVESCGRNVKNASNPIETEVLLHDKGTNERSTANQSDCMTPCHELLLLEFFFELEVAVRELFHFMVDANRGANDVLQFL